jgi:hypothetical protein
MRQSCFPPTIRMAVLPARLFTSPANNEGLISWLELPTILFDPLPSTCRFIWEQDPLTPPRQDPSFMMAVHLINYYCLASYGINESDLEDRQCYLCYPSHLISVYDLSSYEPALEVRSLRSSGSSEVILILSS